MSIALLAALAACGDGGPGSSSGSPTPDLDCVSPTATDLLAPMIERPAYFTTSGGRLRISVSDLPGGLLESIDETRVHIGEESAPPGPDSAQPKRPSQSRREVVVGLEAPVTVDLEKGRWWLVSARGGRITIASCPDVVIADVQAERPDRSEVFGVPSEPPTDQGTTVEETPGTDR